MSFFKSNNSISSVKRLKIKLWLKILIEFWELMVDERLSKGMKWLWKGFGSEDFGRSFEIRGKKGQKNVSHD